MHLIYFSVCVCSFFICYDNLSCLTLCIKYNNTKVTGITKTTNNHESIKKGIEEAIGDDSSKINNFHLSTFDEIPKEKQFKNVVFCAPPSGFDDYPSALQNVIDTIWSGSGSESDDGVFVFTSSGGM